MIRIGRAELVAPLRDVAEKVEQSAETFKAEEEMFADAPDHFLDPIMSILMRDPVKLPTSGQVWLFPFPEIVILRHIYNRLRLGTCQRQ